MSEEIEKMAEKEYPKPPFLGHYGNIARSSRIEGFIKGHQKATEWISVETPPKEKGDYLITTITGVTILNWDGENFYHEDWGFVQNSVITHWQPLPHPPQNKSKN